MTALGTASAGAVAGEADSLAPSQTRFTLLGPLEILRDGVDHAPSAPKALELMAMLVLNPGRVVHLDTIIDELWDSAPPRSVRTTVQTYVYHLRRCITENRLAEDATHMLATRSPGYLLNIPPESVDLFHFRALCRDGRALLIDGRSAEAAAALRQALEMWSGPPLANVVCGPVLTRHVIELQEQRRNVRHLRIEAEIASGQHRELVGELRSLTAMDQLDEGLHGQLMTVLARCGRRSEAMHTYRDLRTRLVNELGVEPSGELRALHLHLLNDAA